MQEIAAINRRAVPLDQPVDYCRMLLVIPIPLCRQLCHSPGKNALEAARSCLKERGASPSKLLEYAKLCKVERLVTPYIEAMVP